MPDKSKYSASALISQQFAHLFNGYAQGFNKKYERTGLLFETPFRRIAITSDMYFSNVIFYIHANPQRHGLCSDFREWLYSSYHAYVTQKFTKLQREKGLEWFGGIKQFIAYHEMQSSKTFTNEQFIIEFD